MLNQPEGADSLIRDRLPVRRLHMTGNLRIFLRKDVAVGRLHALLNRINDSIDDIFAVSVRFNDSEIYAVIWTAKDEFVPSADDIDQILKNTPSGDLSYLVRRYEEVI